MCNYRKPQEATAAKPDTKVDTNPLVSTFLGTPNFMPVQGEYNLRGRQLDLGLALLEVARKPGEPLEVRDIAAWCGCTGQNIRLIEWRALRKLKARAPWLDDWR